MRGRGSGFCPEGCPVPGNLTQIREAGLHDAADAIQEIYLEVRSRIPADQRHVGVWTDGHPTDTDQVVDYSSCCAVEYRAPGETYPGAWEVDDRVEAIIADIDHQTSDTSDPVARALHYLSMGIGDIKP
jgi:hypothetical protein